MPSLDDFIPMLREIWRSKRITNFGPYHDALEKALAEYLGVPYLSLFTNGTLSLMAALRALDISGEVITTPYSFVATSDALLWNGISPVFADIDPATCDIDPKKIEKAITSKTTAIMPVHVYGNPCDFGQIGEIAGRHGLKVIYDASHAFGVRLDGHSLLEYGDICSLSFHATKVYNTIEGGALVSRSAEMKNKIDHIRNFGFKDEKNIVSSGLNGKMDELRAAYGLLNLNIVDKSISSRKAIAMQYRKGIGKTEGIRLPGEAEGLSANYSYFPIFVESEKYGMSRDSLYSMLKKHGICGRRYFYPLISNTSPFSGLPSAARVNLPNANNVAESVICLPIYEGLDNDSVELAINIINDRQ